MKDEDVIEEWHKFDISCHGNARHTCVLWYMLVWANLELKTKTRCRSRSCLGPASPLVSGWGGLDYITIIHPSIHPTRSNVLPYGRGTKISKTKTVQQVNPSHQLLSTIMWVDLIHSPLGSKAPSQQAFVSVNIMSAGFIAHNGFSYKTWWWGKRSFPFGATKTACHHRAARILCSLFKIISPLITAVDRKTT